MPTNETSVRDEVAAMLDEVRAIRDELADQLGEFVDRNPMPRPVAEKCLADVISRLCAAQGGRD